MCNKQRFYTQFEKPAVEVFTSKRLTGLEKAVNIRTGDILYQLARKTKYDGYIYEINATHQQLFTKKDHPEKLFVYTRYYEPVIRTLERNTLERFKIETIWQFNGHSDYDVAGVHTLIDEVYTIARKPPSHPKQGFALSTIQFFKKKGVMVMSTTDAQYIVFNGYYSNQDDGNALQPHTQETKALYEKGFTTYQGDLADNWDMYNGVWFDKDGSPLAEWWIDNDVRYFPIELSTKKECV